MLTHKFSGIYPQHSHRESKHIIPLTFIHLSQYIKWNIQAPDFRISILNHSIIFWRIYEDIVSGDTCRCHPACLWCFTVREIDPADVGVLRAGATFAPPLFFPYLLCFPRFLFYQQTLGQMRQDGQWHIAKRQGYQLCQTVNYGE